MSCSSGTTTNSCTRTYTDGYTSGKRTAHVATVAIFAAIGLSLVFGAWYFRTQPESLFRLTVVIGAVITFVMLLALWPILKQPVVAGRKITA